MISLSEQWAYISKTFYGESFKDELADFLKKSNVKRILECGCGDGNILYSLAQRGLSGLGIDSDQEMISIALRNHQHPNIEYCLIDWLDIDKIPEKYDVVLCRGGSLLTITNWGKGRLDFDPDKTKNKITESIIKMYDRVKNNGILYLDAISQLEIDNHGRNFRIEREDICLNVEIEHDLDRKARYVSGKGKIGNKIVIGDSISYLLSPSDLENLIRDLNPKKVWRPDLKSEINYTAICAIK